MYVGGVQRHHERCKRISVLSLNPLVMCKCKIEGKALAIADARRPHIIQIMPFRQPNTYSRTL